MAGKTMGWDKECAEWEAIKDELIDASIARGTFPRTAPTAHQITTEQRKRMLARGERKMTIDEIHEWVVETERVVRSVM